MAKIGHNSKNKVNGVAGEQLQSIIDRIEKLTEEKQALQGDISEIFAEAKGNGFDCGAIRQILKIRKKDQAEREEEELILGTYMRAIGMLSFLDEDGREDE